MSEILLSWTSLPNLHPAVVHFPVALLSVAVVADLLALVVRGQGWLYRTAALLWGFGGLGAWAAVEAGEEAAHSLVHLPPHVVEHLSQHSDWGHYTLYVAGALALLRLALAWWDRDFRQTALRVLHLAAGVVAVGMVFYTADLGGGLVFEHGVAVEGRYLGAEAAARVEEEKAAEAFHLGGSGEPPEAAPDADGGSQNDDPAAARGTPTP
jgi:uncharacterized membrane protein